MKQDFSIPQLMNRLQSEADAYLFLEELRWGDEPLCPHCSSLGGHYFLKPSNGSARKTNRGTLSQRRVWKCHDCRKQFSVLTGTIFHGSHISIRTWVLVILEMCASKNGVSAREIERKYDLTAKTAWFMLHRIREAMRLDPLATLLVGTIVSDETYIGGKPGNKHLKDRPKHHKWSKPRTDKPVVLSLVNRETGEVRSRVIPDVTGATLAKAIDEQVNVAESDLFTDELRAYKPLGKAFRSHETVTHAAHEYVRKDGVTTNAAESYFSQLKRSIDGTHHHVSREHLERYLAQFDFLRTWCETDDSDRMRGLLNQVGGRRLTYKPLTQSE
jgi:transposase-like protein